jgi:prepilin-type N-terminal cleavage/methylation domain-containing protein
MKKKIQAARGFTLIELMVSVLLFLVIGGAAIGLFDQHAPLFSKQQNLTQLNVNMRNAVAQMQMDIANAGSGYYPGMNFADWPIGVTIQNTTASSNCFNGTTFTYTATCFDQFNIISMDDNTPPGHPSDSTGTNCVSTTATALYVTPPSGVSAATLAADYTAGTQILLVNSNGSQMTTTILTSGGTVVGTMVQLNHNATNSDGSNSSTNDPLGMTTTSNSSLGATFCPTDWVMKLAPVTYFVDTTNSSDPKLSRTQNGTTNVVAEQIIGFKVGATIWNAASNTSSEFYNFSASSYSYNYSLVRSVEISLIGRTPPNQSGPNNFTNSFDGGNYYIQAIDIEVDPRNLSMRD